MCTGAGATLVFSDGLSTFTARVITIGGLSRTSAAVDQTALDSTGYMESCPDELVSIDPLEFTYEFNNGGPWAPVGTKGTVLLTWAPGDGSAGSVTGSGWINNDSTAPMEIGERNVATGQFQFDGVTGPTYSAGT